MAAIHGRFTRSQILIQNGNWGHGSGLLFSFLLYLRSSPCSHCVCLSSPGGEIDCVDKYGNTPLHVAAKYGHELLISTLMTNGADTARYGTFQSALLMLTITALYGFYLLTTPTQAGRSSASV